MDEGYQLNETHVVRAGPDEHSDIRLSPVNGEILQIDQINEFTLFDAKVSKLAWNRPADGFVPIAHYVLNLRTNDIVVSFDKVQYDGRKFASTELRLRCIRPRIKYS
jgi:hypothetical protein